MYVILYICYESTYQIPTLSFYKSVILSIKCSKTVAIPITYLFACFKTKIYLIPYSTQENQTIPTLEKIDLPFLHLYISVT